MFWRNGVPPSEPRAHSRAGTALAGRRVLVTGAAGFIGSHLTEALLGSGADVTALIRYDSRGTIGALRHIPADSRAKLNIVTADLKDLGALFQEVKNIDIVFHLGALIGIPYS